MTAVYGKYLLSLFCNCANMIFLQPDDANYFSALSYLKPIRHSNRTDGQIVRIVFHLFPFFRLVTVRLDKQYVKNKVERVD
jgi:hypothetical protein